MSCSLETWCAHAKRLLKEKSVNEARAELAETLKGLLVDPGFISTYFDEQKGEPQKIIYRDPELGFLVMVHHHQPGRKGPPQPRRLLGNLRRFEGLHRNDGMAAAGQWVQARLR